MELFPILVGLNLSAEPLAEIAEAFDVGLDDVKVLLALFFVENGDVVLAFIPISLLPAQLVLNEVDLVAVLVSFDSDFLPNALDRHKDDAVLARHL